MPTWQNINASKAQQIAGTSNIVYTTPAVQQFHNSALKFWCRFDGTTGIINSQYNVSTVTRISVGNYTITFATPFVSSNSYGVDICTGLSGINGVNSNIYSMNANSFTFITYLSGNGSRLDSNIVCVSGYGLQ